MEIIRHRGLAPGRGHVGTRRERHDPVTVKHLLPGCLGAGIEKRTMVMMVFAGFPVFNADTRMRRTLVCIPVAVGMKMLQISHAVP